MMLVSMQFPVTLLQEGPGFDSDWGIGICFQLPPTPQKRAHRAETWPYVSA